MSLSLSRARLFALAGIAASAILLGLYSRGGLGWPLGFVALLPWLLTLNQTKTLGGALLSGWLMSVAFALAVFAWFGTAVGSFTGIGIVPAMLLLCVLAPLLQPQVWVYAVVRHFVGQSALLRALAGAAAWVACEWLWPKLLGDTLGHGLAGAAHLRQVAELGGAAGLTVLLILVNEALTHALLRWRDGVRAWLAPLALAVATPALMFGYGALQLTALREQAQQPAPYLRIGLVQSGLVDYENLRREIGAYAVVRKVLDTHFALSRAAIEHHGAEVLLWSETVYPTTFAQPRSADGAALDQEILDFVSAAGVPLVFGTYDVDSDGEYNAAAFVEPSGLLGFYRKTFPFPLTEHVPGWLDSALLRRWLPWTGSWQPGSGARVFPLRAADGRSLQVLPLICLDDVSANLAIDGARLGAQAIIGLSNDAWFSADPLGAHLHLAVASFRSIETRLPQLRVTSNGLSAYIDPSGEVLVKTAMGEQSVLAGEIPARNPEPTLMVRWGDWVGGVALAFLLTLAGSKLWGVWAARRRPLLIPHALMPETDFSAKVVLLAPMWRWLVALLRIGSAVGLLSIAVLMGLRYGWQVNSLALIKLYGWAVLLPAISAWAIQRAFAATAQIEGNHVVLRQRSQRIEIPVANITLLQVWRLPLPSFGVNLHLMSGRVWPQGLQLANPQRLLAAINAAGGAARLDEQHIADYAAIRVAAQRPWLDHPLIKFGLFPLLPALPAFRLHQYIAFGGTFGELYTYGLFAWQLGLLIWWAAWSIGLMLFAALMRVFSEVCTLLAMRFVPAQAASFRRYLEGLLRVIFYLGVPIWLLIRIVSA